MTGPHSGPYPTGDPNLTEEQQREQAGQILAKLSTGKSMRAVAAEMGISRNTLSKRLSLITEPGAMIAPSRSSLRVINLERTERLIERLSERVEEVEESIPLADLVKVSGELRQLLARQDALFRLGEDDPADPSDDPSEVEDDDWEAREL